MAEINFKKYIGEPNKERLIKAFKREEIDRIPNFEGLIEDKHVEKMLGRYAGNTFAFGGDPAKGKIDLNKTRPMFAKDYIEICKIIGQDVIMLADNWTPFKKEDQKNSLVLAFDKSVKNLKDFRKLIKPDYKDIEKIINYIKEYKEAVVNTKIGIAVSFGSLFQTLYAFIVGFEDFMIACFEDRNFIEEMLEISTDYWIEFSKAVVHEKVDIICIGDDVAFKSGLFIPPKLFSEIWIPRMTKIIEPAVKANIPVQFHSDGKIDDIVEDLIEMGVDCLNPMDPYCIDYKEYKKKYNKNLTLSGNIDIGFPLVNGTPEDVEKDVKEHMKVLKPGYGYVACSSHSIVNYIPFENFITMINSIHKYGLY